MVSSSFRVMKYVSWCITNSTHIIGMSGVAEYAHYSTVCISATIAMIGVVQLPPSSVMYLLNLSI